ncbi:MAG: glycyl-radical enzyme activating protein [Desulfobacterales bacterium]|nr:glycyl-radical enzyme activating protein [Desulfobacterales bacterium]
MKALPRTPLIMDVKGNSLDDGPGIRTVVFFKGCPLSCVWCHNPECISAKVEISFDPDACIGCDSCADVCTRGALSRDNPRYIDRDKCDLCFDCVDACPSEALQRVGMEMTIEEALPRILKDKPFFDTSGGGVTVSGGEPGMFMAYVSGLLQELKKEGVHTLMETCGLFDFNRFKRRILPFLDVVYMDIKFHDPGEHKRYCGVSNEVILDNFVKIRALSTDGGFEILPRAPLIPGITDTEANLGAIADFLRENRAEKVQLLAYNPLWHEKRDKIGVENRCEHEESMRKWMPGERVAWCKDVFRERGVEAF